MKESVSPPFTKAHFDRFVRALWSQQGTTLGEGHRIGMRISDLVAYSKRRNAKVEVPYLDLWLSIFDELLSWQMSFLVVFYAQRRRRSFSKFDQSILTLAIKIFADSLAVRHLIIAGFDTAAGVLVRSIGEHAELFVAILDDPTLARQFRASDTPKKAQKFWASHLARGALRRRVLLSWEKVFDDKDPQAAKEIHDWVRSSNTIHSAFVHPSFGGGMISGIPFKTKHTEESWPSFWGDKSDGSAMTIRSYVSLLFPMFLLSRDFPFSGFNRHLGSPIKFKKGNEFHRHVRNGRAVICSIILSIMAPSNKAYMLPDYDMSIFSKKPRRKRRNSMKRAGRRR